MKNILAIATLGFCAVSAAAEDLPANVNICAGVSDDRARLACFDGLAARAARTQPVAPVAAPKPPEAQPFVTLPNQGAAPVAAAPAAAPSVVPAPVAVPSAAPVSRSPSKVDEFGAETIRKTQTREEAAKEPQEVQEVRGKVTAVDLGKTGKFTVTLDNGQVWRQIESDTGRARFSKQGDTVVISHGLLGSYNLVFEGREMTLFKVRRVK
ncbi:hypothetical protein FHS83_000179 [Rhizomicrobium palustre]|uniref:Uncharacterized protein n=1 Tax=Rhizomicrobium palustre TaxID=189966 RepID=A0A846MUI4_9PROT|nr:hypothetical protein [Rhizomicrobium palustre]NIK86861.1 hypothetical protein [Rhizomicrobium palustre]